MNRALRRRVIDGTALALVLVAVQVTPALASRPTTTLTSARTWLAADHTRVAASASASAYWAGRGGRTRAPLARPARNELPPKTHRSDPAGRPTIAWNGHDGRRRTPDLRTLLQIVARTGAPPCPVEVAVRDRRNAAPGAVFHDAHAPPAANATDVVAGRDS